MWRGEGSPLHHQNLKLLHLARSIAHGVGCPARRSCFVEQGLQVFTFLIKHGLDVLTVDDNTVKGGTEDIIDLAAAITQAD